MADPRSDAGPVIRSVEFYNIELAPLADGRVYVSMLATTVDDQEPQLLTQEIACDTVATIEDALAVIRQRRCSEGLSRPLAIPPARWRANNQEPPAVPTAPFFCYDGARPADCCGRRIDQDDRPPFFGDFMLSVEALLMVLPMSFTCSLSTFICDWTNSVCTRTSSWKSLA